MTIAFKNDFQTEWARLNPPYSGPAEGLKKLFLQGFHEGIHWYFAPLRLMPWLVKATFRWVGGKR